MVFAYIDGELSADGADFFVEGGREHHDLLLVRGLSENGLHVATHVGLLQKLVAFVKNEPLELVQLHVTFFNERFHAPRGTTHNVRRVLLKHLLMQLVRNASVNLLGFDIRKVFAEALELLANLVGQVANVREAKGINNILPVLFFRANEMQRRKDEDSCLSHSRFGLANDIMTEDRLWNTGLLN